MGQKDLAAKQMEGRAEVFADIINALIYEGEQAVDPGDLQPAPTESLYRTGKGTLRNQYNDISRYEMRDGGIITQYTLENQSHPDHRILLRKAGYEGGIYRQQYDGGGIYPAVTLVLYWGGKNWHPHADMHSFFRRKKLDQKVQKYIDNIKLHVYPMRRLPPEVRRRFRSDMRILVDYLAEGKDYEPTEQNIENVEDVMRMLYLLTGEGDFKENMEPFRRRQEKGEQVTMCEVVDKFVERGRKQGIEEGIEQGIQEGIRQGIEQGIQEGIRQGAQQGIQQENMRCAKSFVEENVARKQPKEYIMEMLRVCFRMKEEEAAALYRECAV